METKLEFDIESLLDELKSLPNENLVNDWLAAIAELARQKAFEKAQKEHGRSFWQREIVHSIRENDLGGGKGEVFSDSIIADHVHTGGTIRPKNAKFLAIPIHRKSKGKSASEYNWPGGKPQLIVDKSAGANGRCFLAENLKTKSNFLYVLKRSVYQKPRPWWPTEDEINHETQNLWSDLV